MSAPEGGSVNDGIGKSLGTLSYVGIEDASDEIRRLGPGALLAKVDVKAAYRNVPVHPEDRWLMGMLWEGELFIDSALPFGLRSAPKIFTAVADAVEWIVRQMGGRFVIHYLDDFLVIGAPNSPECGEALRCLLEVFKRLGIPVAINKLEGPVTLLEFLGFEMDTLAMAIRLPPRKLSDLLQLLCHWRGKGSCKRKELESLVGKLGHASRVVPPGRTFLRRLFELLRRTRRGHHHIRLNKFSQADIQWWATFLESWNGISMISPPELQQIHVWTDASGQFGCGGIDPGQKAWFQLRWPERYSASWVQLKEESIALKELLPIVIACALWGRHWRNQFVKFHCDNLGVVALVNSGCSKIPQLMHLLRCLFFIRAHFQLAVSAVHVPGIENTLADAISRNQLHILFAQVPEAMCRRVEIPPNLLSLLVEDQPDWTSPTWVRLFSSCFPPA